MNTKDLFKNKIKDCQNTNSIFNTKKYVELDDAVNIVEHLIALLEASGVDTGNDKCHIQNVSNNEVAVCDNCHKNPVLRYDKTTGLDLCSDCYRKAN